MRIERYVLVDRNDNEADGAYGTMAEAITAAGDDHAVIARIFTFDDSEVAVDARLVWTPDGSHVWPPRR